MITMMKTYLTNNLFNKTDYVATLKRIGVDAYPTKNGIKLDIDQYKANYHPATAPIMLSMNHRWIKALY